MISYRTQVEFVTQHSSKSLRGRCVVIARGRRIISHSLNIFFDTCGSLGIHTSEGIKEMKTGSAMRRAWRMSYGDTNKLPFQHSDAVSFSNSPAFLLVKFQTHRQMYEMKINCLSPVYWYPHVSMENTHLLNLSWRRRRGIECQVHDPKCFQFHFLFSTFT